MSTQSGNRKKVIWYSAFLFILGLAFFLRMIHLDFGLPQRLHVDEPSQVETAWRIAQGDFNPHFFRYPASFMYLLAFIFKIYSMAGQNTSLANLYLLGRWVSVGFGVGTVAITIFLQGFCGTVG